MVATAALNAHEVRVTGLDYRVNTSLHWVFVEKKIFSAGTKQTN